MELLWYGGNAGLSRLIRRITRSPYSHVAVAIDGVVYEAIGRGIVKHTGQQAERVRARAVAHRMLDLDPEDVLDAKLWLESVVGNSYSVLGFVNAGLVSLGLTRLVVSLRGEYICSGLAATALQIAGEIFEEPRTETPGSLAAIYEPVAL